MPKSLFFIGIFSEFFCILAFSNFHRSKTAQRPPRPPQDGPRDPQESPKTAQEALQTAQEAPKTGQEGPKTGQEGPKTGPREAQDSDQEASRGSREASRLPWGTPTRPRPLRGPKRSPKRPPKQPPRCFKTASPESPQASSAPRIGTATVRDSIYNPALVQSETAPFCVLWERFSGARKIMANDDDGDYDTCRGLLHMLSGASSCEASLGLFGAFWSPFWASGESLSASWGPLP